MIRSFRSKPLRRFTETGDPSKLSVVNTRRVAAIIERLDGAVEPADMNLAGWRFYPLKGTSSDRYAVSVSGNWRLTFGWDGVDAIDVDMEDYH